MNKNEIINKISINFNKAKFQLKKNSPEILVITGVIGTVASAVIACRATTKIGTILNEAKENIDVIHNAVEDKSLKDTYSIEDSKKDLTIVYAKTGIKLVQLYSPAIILGSLSITSILAGHNILRKRNIALGAAYATIDKGFKAYRKRVVEKFGEDVDRELKYNIKTKKYEEVTIDENGKEKKSKVAVNVANAVVDSPYAKFFDECSPCWHKDADANLFFLKEEQRYANDLLRAKGYLFLNDVYERLGIPRTKAGQSVGWIYDPDDQNIDNYVDFGIIDLYRDNTEKRDFVNGYERSILLDFNVDGPILDKFEVH